MKKISCFKRYCQVFCNAVRNFGINILASVVIKQLGRIPILRLKLIAAKVLKVGGNFHLPFKQHSLRNASRYRAAAAARTTALGKQIGNRRQEIDKKKQKTIN